MGGGAMESRGSGRVEKYRAHNSAVNRLTSTVTTGAVTAVDPVDPMKNNTKFLSYNSLLASDEFYDKLSKLQKEYKRFYHDQQELEKALKDMSENSDALIENLRKLVEKYNLAMQSLKMFDLYFNVNNRKNIEDIMDEFRDNLKDIGIEVSEDGTLKLYEFKFKRSVTKSNDAIKFLFRPIKGLIIKIHRAFRNIRVPEEEVAYFEYGGRAYNGLFTDVKA